MKHWTQALLLRNKQQRTASHINQGKKLFKKKKRMKKRKELNTSIEHTSTTYYTTQLKKEKNTEADTRRTHGKIAHIRMKPLHIHVRFWTLGRKRGNMKTVIMHICYLGTLDTIWVSYKINYTEKNLFLNKKVSHTARTYTTLVVEYQINFAF